MKALYVLFKFYKCNYPCRIACGFSDGNNKMWDLSQPHLQRVILNPIFEKHTIKLTSFAWHPTKEDCLAYGTIDGYIGLIDASSLSKSPTQLVQSSAAAVCHLQWGPLDSDGVGLYTVANGKLLVYNVKHPLHGKARYHTCCSCYTHFRTGNDRV